MGKRAVGIIHEQKWTVLKTSLSLEEDIAEQEIPHGALEALVVKSGPGPVKRGIVHYYSCLLGEKRIAARSNKKIFHIIGSRHHKTKSRGQQSGGVSGKTTTSSIP